MTDDPNSAPAACGALPSGESGPAVTPGPAGAEASPAPRRSLVTNVLHFMPGERFASLKGPPDRPEGYRAPDEDPA
jgi:hypothetical protein